jgi:hypothetical protein
VDNHSSAEFGQYDSPVGLGISALAGVFSSDAQRMPSRRDGIRLGDEGKAVGYAQAPAALLPFHNVTSRSVITITEFAVSPEAGLKLAHQLRQLGAIFTTILRAS